MKYIFVRALFKFWFTFVLGLFTVSLGLRLHGFRQRVLDTQAWNKNWEGTNEKILKFDRWNQTIDIDCHKIRTECDVWSTRRMQVVICCWCYLLLKIFNFVQCWGIAERNGNKMFYNIPVLFSRDELSLI